MNQPRTRTVRVKAGGLQKACVLTLFPHAGPPRGPEAWTGHKWLCLPEPGGIQGGWHGRHCQLQGPPGEYLGWAIRPCPEPRLWLWEGKRWTGTAVQLRTSPFSPRVQWLWLGSPRRRFGRCWRWWPWCWSWGMWNWQTSSRPMGYQQVAFVMGKVCTQPAPWISCYNFCSSTISSTIDLILTQSPSARLGVLPQTCSFRTPCEAYWNEILMFGRPRFWDLSESQWILCRNGDNYTHFRRFSY